MSKKFRFTRPLLAAFLLISLSSGVAQAGKPDTYHDEFWDYIEIVDCGDFSIMDDNFIMLDGKIFFDKDGNFIREQMHFRGFDDLYRDDDPEGTHLTGTAHLNVRISFDTNGDALWTQQGLAVAIIVPGYGPLFLDAGKLVFNMDNEWEIIFSAGKHHDWNFGDFDALCEFFDQD